MAFDPNELFFKLCKVFKDRVSKDSKAIVGNEGSSRSSKTWDAIHFFVSVCQANPGKSYDIYFIRDTLVNCRDFTLKEFEDCLKVIGIYDPRCMVNSPKPVYKLFGHKIKFRGLDDEQSAEGYPSDFLFFNEVLECNKSGVMGLIMRCRKMVIMDWNPKYTDHFIFDMEKRPDVVFFKSTYKNNKHLQKSVVKEIESYSPWHMDDMHLPEDQRRPHEENIRNGTADKYRWKVYGLGERCSREGLVFPSVTWINVFPEDLEHVSYGMDFGTSAPTAIVKSGMRENGKGKKPDLYLQKLHYAPTENSDEVNEVLDILSFIPDEEDESQIGKPPGSEPGLSITKHLWADNNNPGWIADLEGKGKLVFPTRKFPGSREYWITTLQRFNIHIVRDPDFRKEQENFCYRVVDGKQLSETIKAYDHLWSASGYSVVGDFRDIISNE